MRRLLFLLTSLFLFAGYAHAENRQADQNAADSNCATLEVFYSTTCPHCARALEYIEQLRIREPGISIALLEVRASAEITERFLELNERFGLTRPSVPAFHVCNTFLTGFISADTTGEQIESLLGLGADSSANASVPLSTGEADPQSIETDHFGTLSVDSLGLPLFTIVIGLIDGFNPCAMWVLLFLLSLLVNLKSRVRMAAIAGTFVAVSGLVYFAIMAAWLNVFLVIGFSRALQVALGLLALTIALVNFKDFTAVQFGPSFSIPDKSKPGIYQRFRKVVHAENLQQSLAAVVVVAVLVNMVELLCTAGLPALYTQILSTRELSATTYYGYLALYNLAYVFDDGLMVTVAVVTLSHRKLQEGQGRWLKLLSALVLGLLGALLVFAPQYLQ